ncbi:MAG: THxN family PEP-CTERM protein [Rhodocyclaceae bacterium]|nr:THxN family PEP-CTERM protein [Rhodocyclaceae bacterium]MBK6552374.1 THxN family PEP-CTERM protein [Rhodocyclaceae bacterium]MBK9311911.1 THxN family PEP-CTERM protein [Rhodocyclaceae bacterium]MBK9956738.1 THxN family PEP-CTERM protein [Rhodocyclaceae bacterium]
MKPNSRNDRPSPMFKALAIAGSVSLAVATSAAQATMLDGIVDQWTVGVSTIFDTSSIVDSNGSSPGGVTVVNNKSLRWGNDLGSGLSGLDISGSPASGTVLTNGPAVGNVSITHLNRPITGDTLRSLDILSTLTLTPWVPAAPGLPAQTLSFTVHYAETTNNANPCADGGVNGVGVNVNGCADIYVTDANSLNFSFFYDLDGGGSLQNQQYYISFFELTSGLKPLNTLACTAAGVASPCLGFETPEGLDTTVQFASLITTEKVHIDVPEPSSLALAGLGLLGLGLRRRRRD